MIIVGTSLQPQDEYPQKSGLSKSLAEVLKDHEAVTFLIQYMESCKASSLIRFWLDAESFQASTWTRIRTHSLQSVSKSSLVTSKSDLSVNSLTKSLNKDITSPVSGASIDILDRDEPVSRENSSSALDSDLVKTELGESADHNETETEENGTKPNQNSDLTNKEKDTAANQNRRPDENLKDCDPRKRERCKSGETSNMILPVVTCDNSADDKTAISYRDIASVSPTNEGGTGGVSGARPSLAASNNLAEKLKKSKPVLSC